MSKEKNNIELSIIIVSYNVRYFLEQCLLSVQDACKNINAEIIIIDNNSDDTSCEMVNIFIEAARNDISVKLITNKENIGFSKANNQGVTIAKGKYVLILNPDTVVAEDTFEKIINFAKTKTNLGALGSKLIGGTGHFLPESKRGIPTPRVSFNKLLGVSSKQTGKYYASHLKDDESGIVEILVGAFMFLKKDIYTEVKGFDEDYFMYGEDIDLSYKILKKGYQNYYFADTQTIHYKGESTKKDVKYLRYFYGAMNIFYKKHFKLNVIYDFLMSFGIHFWYLMKYFKLKTTEISHKKISKFIYIGKDASTFAKLKIKINSKLAIHHTSVSIEDILINKIDTIILDNNSIANKEIIKTIQQLKDKQISFRFIPRDCNYFIGSDSSFGRGEVVSILKKNVTLHR
ncbi:MAG: glycosyltransferase family 2 protein [Flavobacteriaceae bacterium]|nr:glycosyltransferase family 2 protein [Flavobacteriaceae bacterium]